MTEPEPLFVYRPPDWKRVRRPASLEPELPQTWLDYEIHWEYPPQVRPVFIKQFSLSLMDRSLEIFLFGLRFELTNAIWRGERKERGHFAIFDVWETGEGCEPKRHRLAQHRTSTYSEVAERNDDLAASKVRHPERHSLARPPIWKRSAAFWPTLGGEIMAFLGQAALPETPVTTKHLSWDEALYLFYAIQGEDVVFKLVEQSLTAQTAEEHYALEEAMWKLAQPPVKPKRPRKSSGKKQEGEDRA